MRDFNFKTEKIFLVKVNIILTGRLSKENNMSICIQTSSWQLSTCGLDNDHHWFSATLDHDSYSRHTDQ